jgi:hypothetical protein
MTCLENPEVYKYRGLYTHPQRAARYGHTCHGAKALPIIDEWKPVSLLDIGCGWNEFAAKVRTLANPPRNVIGTDFACPGADLIADATSLPFERKQFDTVTAFDMLEHLRPEQVDTVLAEMARVSKRFIFSISHVDSVNRWEGQTLHPTVRPEEWWMHRLMRAGAGHLRKRGHYITGTWFDTVLRIPAETTVALVGNGPSLLTAHHGPTIDQHEEVVRFNSCRITGYESHTGTRTTLWSTFGKGTVPADPDFHPDRILYIHGETGAPSIDAPHIYRIPRYFFDRTQDLVHTASQWTTDAKLRLIPSSGFIIARYFLEVTGITRLTLAGFDHFNKAHSSQHHYWNPGPFTRPKEHDGDAEATLLDAFHKQNRIQYLS